MSLWRDRMDPRPDLVRGRRLLSPDAQLPAVQPMTHNAKNEPREEWWITEDHWLPRGRIAEHQGVPLGPFGSRDLALTVRTLVERAQGRDGALWVGRVGERDLNRAEETIAAALCQEFCSCRGAECDHQRARRFLADHCPAPGAPSQ